MSDAGHVHGGSVVAAGVGLVRDEPHRRLADDGAGEQPVAFGGDRRVGDRLVDRSFGRRASGAATVERTGRRDPCQDKHGTYRRTVRRFGSSPELQYGDSSLRPTERVETADTTEMGGRLAKPTTRMPASSPGGTPNPRSLERGRVPATGRSAWFSACVSRPITDAGASAALDPRSKARPNGRSPDEQRLTVVARDPPAGVHASRGRCHLDARRRGRHRSS